VTEDCFLRAELSSTTTTNDNILVTSCQVMKSHGYCSNFVLLRLCRVLQHSFRALPRSRVVGQFPVSSPDRVAAGLSLTPLLLTSQGGHTVRIKSDQDM